MAISRKSKQGGKGDGADDEVVLEAGAETRTVPQPETPPPAPETREQPAPSASAGPALDPDVRLEADPEELEAAAMATRQRRVPIEGYFRLRGVIRVGQQIVAPGSIVRQRGAKRDAELRSTVELGGATIKNLRAQNVLEQATRLVEAEA